MRLPSARPDSGHNFELDGGARTARRAVRNNRLGCGTKFLAMIFTLAFRAKNYDDTYTFTGRGFPLPVRHERGQGEGEGLPNKDGLLSPTLSSIVPLAEREQAPFAFIEEFCLAPIS